MELENQAGGPANPKVSYVFVLCHGTFAPRAEWVHKPTSALRVALQTGLADHLVSFEPHIWRGLFSSFLNNAHRYRVRGGERLRTKLVELRRKHPSAELYVIAHSHGGNVALYAMQNRSVADAVTGVVCMATPFFVVRPDDGVQSAAEGWLGLLQGMFVLGVWVPPVAVFASVIWLSVQILPLLNHYVQFVVGPLFTHRRPYSCRMCQPSSRCRVPDVRKRSWEFRQHSATRFRTTAAGDSAAGQARPLFTRRRRRIS